MRFIGVRAHLNSFWHLWPLHDEISLPVLRVNPASKHAYYMDSPIPGPGANHSLCYPGPGRPNVRLADLAGPVPRQNRGLERVKVNAVLRLGATAWRAVRSTVNLCRLAGVDEHDQIVPDISQMENLMH